MGSPMIIIQLSFSNSMVTCVKARHYLILNGSNLSTPIVAFKRDVWYTHLQKEVII